MASDDSRWRTMFLGIYLAIFTFVLLHLLIQLWPAVETGDPAANAQASDHTIELFGAWNLTLTEGTAFVALAIVMGAVGSTIHASTSFASYVGNRTLTGSWTWWYVLRTFIGGPLGLLVYFVALSGLVALGSGTTGLNPFSVAAVTGLAGLFSKQAIDWLDKVFNSVFESNVERADTLDEARPEILSSAPESVESGQEATVTLRGTSFPTDLKVVVEGDSLPADNVDRVSAEEVVVTIPAELLTPESITIVVGGVGPDSLSSDPYVLSVFDAALADNPIPVDTEE